MNIKKFFLLTICCFTLCFFSLSSVEAASSVSNSGKKSNDTGYLYGYVTMMRLTSSTACMAETISSGRVNKKTVAISVQYKNGTTFWKPSKLTVTEDSECSLYNSSLKKTSSQLNAFTTHETIYTTSSVLYLKTTLSAN